MSVTQNIEVSVSEGQMCDTYLDMHFRPIVFARIIAMAVFWESNTKATTLQYSVGVTKLSVERGSLVLRVYNWEWITVRCTE